MDQRAVKSASGTAWGTRPALPNSSMSGPGTAKPLRSAKRSVTLASSQGAAKATCPTSAASRRSTETAPDGSGVSRPRPLRTRSA
jgi:hypothetical protein